MTVLCYIKPETYPNLLNRASNSKLHHPTYLDVFSDGKGFYVMLLADLFQEPDVCLRADLEPDIAWFSAKVQVDHESYTADKSIATGNYTCDDPDVTIVVTRQITNINGALHREMKVKAPTWEKLKLALEKIRQGEITPLGSEQTVLEKALAELEEAKGELAGLGRSLQWTKRENIEYQRVVAWCTNFLADQPYDVGDSELMDDRKFRALRKEVVTARNAAANMARIKATRWYRLWEWLTEE